MTDPLPFPIEHYVERHKDVLDTLRSVKGERYTTLIIGGASLRALTGILDSFGMPSEVITAMIVNLERVLSIAVIESGLPWDEEAQLEFIRNIESLVS